MPTFLGAGRAGIIGGSAGGGAVFGTQDNPITNDATGALWLLLLMEIIVV